VISSTCDAHGISPGIPELTARIAPETEAGTRQPLQDGACQGLLADFRSRHEGAEQPRRCHGAQHGAVNSWNNAVCARIDVTWVRGG
jgi:hypothetical protein